VLDVGPGFGATEQPQPCDLGESGAQGVHVRAMQKRVEAGVTDEDHRDDQLGVEVEVYEHSEGREDLWAHVLGLVDDDDQASGLGGCEGPGVSLQRI